MYGNQIIPLLRARTEQAEIYRQDIRYSKTFDSFVPKVGIPKNLNHLIVDLYNLTLEKTSQSMVLSGSVYSPSQTPSLGSLVYIPVTIKVEVRKEGIPVNNSRVYLFDMNMLCVGQTVTDVDGFAYFYNRPSTYLYHVLSEDAKGEYVSTIVNKLPGV